jgi:hypothetical protein
MYTRLLISRNVSADFKTLSRARTVNFMCSPHVLLKTSAQQSHVLRYGIAGIVSFDQLRWSLSSSLYLSFLCCKRFSVTFSPWLAFFKK